MSFLALEGLHVFVTGAAGGIGSAIVDEFLAQGANVSAHDLKANPHADTPSLFHLQGDISSESAISSSIASAVSHFGPINILCANAGITDESNEYPIWSMPIDLWEKTYAINVRGTFLTIKHFLASVEQAQVKSGVELNNIAVVVTGSETGVFGQAGHVEYASGKSGLQYGLVKSVKNEIVKLNGKARINAVAPGWVDTKLIAGRLDDANEMYKEAQATVPLKKIARPSDVARAAAFLASHRAAGHISGQCISVDGGMEGRIVWSEDEILKSSKTLATPSTSTATIPSSRTSIPQTLSPCSKRTIKILISIDFDAVSGWLGTGAHADNNMADYSTGFFAAQVGVPRMLKLFKRMGIEDKVTWFVPMHSAESFPDEFSKVVESGAEIGLHGYCHEGAPQLTPAQEKDVLEHCLSVCTRLSGKKPVGYRAPLYQVRESTIALLEEHSFLYDTSLSHHDSRPYYLPNHAPIIRPDFSETTKASEWMHPLPKPPTPTAKTLVEIPGNWYSEDMTPLQYWPHSANSQGYVDVRAVERMWMDRFEFIRTELADMPESDTMVFPLVLHPDTSGMAHVIGMLERFIGWLKGWEGEVEFCTFESVAREWKGKNSCSFRN
ncbi:polysaccharide deacetylase family protein-like protein [Pleomassaria siparia CBS 279.74]|uniref:Polysaccharide deacetylase family protein-like protein n=1 Tax=Pleomassaria siparia CBS 279.74 TaxID=1314801 RepID=A0A6G1JVX0_9PLEO|nr:polysaccharide deacetylase family protein-like protein [Pleomassaria siparia CBS 279.74]